MTTAQRLLRFAARTPELRGAVLFEIRRVADLLDATRNVYLPREVHGTPPEIPHGTDLAVWKYEANNIPYAIAFVAKQTKPFWSHRFRNEADRQHFIDQTAEARRQAVKRKQDKVDARKNFAHGLKKGDILYCSGGYDQTNIDWYEVTDVVGKSVVIHKIGSKEGPGHSTVVPQPGRFVGAPLRKIPQGTDGAPYVKITSFSTARPWDGKPMYVTPFGAGH